MQIRMLSLMKRKGTYENHPFGDDSTDQSSIPEENSNDRAKPFNLSKYVSIFGVRAQCCQMSPVLVHGLGTKILPDLQCR